MKTLKKIILGIGIVIVLFLLVALFLPSQYHVERSIVINQPVHKVYPNVADLNNWIAWNPWTQMEPTAKSSVKGTGNEVGSVWSWEGKNIGVGSLTIKNIEPNKGIRSRLVFVEPQQFESDDIWQFEQVDEGTKVKWIMEGELNYPVNRYFGLFMDGMLGPDFEKGLANLKQISEQS